MRASRAGGLVPFRRLRRGFTLVEMLVVICIIVLMSVLLSSAIPALVSSGGFNKTVGDLSSVLSQARAYAMANNTYVFVGLQETNQSTSPAAAQTAGNGRLYVYSVASLDGSAPYDTTNISAGFTTAGGGTDLVPIMKPVYFDNVHLVDDATLPNTGNMTRAPMGAEVSASAASSPFAFAYPLAGPNPTATTICTFNNIIQFDSQGTALMLSGANPGTLTQWIEIPLVPTHGTTLEATPTDVAAIQIGSTGAVRIFRP